MRGHHLVFVWLAVQCLEHTAGIDRWNSEDDLRMLRLVYRLGYASWLQKRCSEALLQGLEGEGTSAQKLQVSNPPHSRHHIAFRHFPRHENNPAMGPAVAAVVKRKPSTLVAGTWR